MTHSLAASAAAAAELAQRHLACAAPAQQHLFDAVRPPVLAAWGAGVDSTAMLIELIERGETVDWVLFADMGSERPETYACVEIFRAWLGARGVPFSIVRYTPTNFKNWPPYRSLEENCLTNGTLPSLAFGFGSCFAEMEDRAPESLDQGVGPRARDLAAGGKVIKLTGYDCSPADSRRYAECEGYSDERYLYRYPLREWGWTLERYIERIAAAGLPVPPKSACFFLCLHDVSRLIIGGPTTWLRAAQAEAAGLIRRLEESELAHSGPVNWGLPIGHLRARAWHLSSASRTLSRTTIISPSRSSAYGCSDYVLEEVPFDASAHRRGRRTGARAFGVAADRGWF